MSTVENMNFGLPSFDSFHYWGSDLYENAVTAIGASHTQIEVSRLNSCTALHALIKNCRLLLLRLSQLKHFQA